MKQINVTNKCNKTQHLQINKSSNQIKQHIFTKMKCGKSFIKSTQKICELSIMINQSYLTIKTAS